MSTVAEFVLNRLQSWGVRRCYGYPGDGINGFFGALQRADGAVAFVQARHEETAAIMACAHYKFSGEIAVCVATSGPGAVHLLNGLYDAKKDKVPMVAVVGQQPRASLGADFHQELDLDAMFAPVASFVATVTTPEGARHIVDQALRTALATSSPTVVILPNDVQELEAVSVPPMRHGMQRTSNRFTSPEVRPAQADLREAAELLNRGDRVAMLIGSGAAGAVEQVLQVRELLQAGVSKALLGKDVIGDDEPWMCGSHGLLGTRASWKLMQEADTLLLIGTDFPYGEFLPPEGSVRSVQIELDPRRAGLRYPVDVPLVGDAALTLDALIPMLQPRPADGEWILGVERNVREWHDEVARQAMVPADPINPQRVVWELNEHLPDDVIVTADSGTAAYWYGHTLRLRRGMRGSLSGQLASMGVAVPYAIAAKFTHPDRPAVALIGDGAMQMNGLAELATIRHYQDRWVDPRLIVCVFDNRDLNFVTWEERVMAGDPRFATSQDLPVVPYAQFARSLGFEGVEIDDPDEIGSAWSRAFTADRPCVLQFHVDASTPPLPPHITFEQAKHMMFALAHDEDRESIVKQSARQLAASLHLPSR